jgi:hypothetical protein
LERKTAQLSGIDYSRELKRMENQARRFGDSLPDTPAFNDLRARAQMMTSREWGRFNAAASQLLSVVADRIQATARKV